MHIGMFYQMQVPRPSSRSYEADRFLEMLDQVAYAEEMGLTSVWMADHQFRTEWSHSSDPDDCIRYLESYAEAGVDEVIPLFQVGGIFHEEVMDTLRLFGKHVIPHFNAKASSSSGSPAR